MEVRHVERRPLNFVVIRIDQMKAIQNTRERDSGRPKKIIRETIKKNLEMNIMTLFVPCSLPHLIG